QKNFSGQGFGRDFVLADAQDGSGTSNANFATPVDGSSGRMQMFLWPTAGASASNNTLGVVYPNSIKGKYFGPQSTVGSRLSPTGLPGKVVLVRDSNATTNFACGLIANANELAGNIALIDRGGSCGTTSTANRAKIKRAQDAGAIGVILAHNTNGITPTAVTGTDNSITIPSIFIGFGTGVMLKTAMSTDSVYVILFDSSDYNTAIIYDSDFDNGVIAHEYGHGISNRLTGGPNNSSCLGNQEQAGEGWSDFITLALTTRTWENGNNASRGIGTWLISQDTTGVGIRNYRYSRNMSINPVTYNSIKTLSVPHGVGSVWCSMLYDIYWNMIDKYGYDADWYKGTGGNNKTMQLVIDGLKLQKCSPGFVDARDAIILADSLNNNGENKELLWKAFARRGLGFNALQGNNNSRSDGTENFDLPPGITGLNQLNINSQLSLYPNPSNSYFMVDVFGGSTIQSVEILDLNGKLVQTYINPNKHLPSATVILDAHEAGYYLVKVNTNNGVGYKKLLVN
ncbi:MAG: M36 family metallopeptidase, partial [Bacteroidota bacterium]|nr:M36 family metallopeptidase [Bacteroidota bacterium]